MAENPRKGIVAAVDPGARRMGLAVSDESKTFAFPAGYVDATGDPSKDARRVLDEVRHRGVVKIIVGEARSLSGGDTASAQWARKLAEALTATGEVEVELWDERLTSAQAERVLLDADLRRRHRRRVRDQMAAQIMLQCYLDRLRAAGHE